MVDLHYSIFQRTLPPSITGKATVSSRTGTCRQRKASTGSRRPRGARGSTGRTERCGILRTPNAAQVHRFDMHARKRLKSRPRFMRSGLLHLS